MSLKSTILLLHSNGLSTRGWDRGVKRDRWRVSTLANRL